jgi:hypothetical protein
VRVSHASREFSEHEVAKIANTAHGGIIRAKMALHLRLIAHRNYGEMDIGGKSIYELIADLRRRRRSYGFR